MAKESLCAAKPEEGVASSSSIRKPGLWIGSLLGLMLLLMIVVFWMVSGSRGTVRSPLPPAVGETDRSQAPIADLHPKDGVYDIGTVKIDTKHITTYGKEMLPGLRLRGSPAGIYQYDMYHNGIKVAHIDPSTGKTTPVPGADNLILRKDDPNLKTVGFRLSPGQGIEEIRFAYVVYRGKNPPEGWYEAAFLTEHAAAK